MENMMLSKCYETTEVDRRTWLHVPSGLFGPLAVTLQHYYIKIFLLIILSQSLTWGLC